MKTELDENTKIITSIVCNYFELDKKKVFKMSRKRNLVRARQIIFYLSRKYTKKSTTDIGNVSSYYGRPTPHDHASILHACNMIQDLCDTDRKFRETIDEIEYIVKKTFNELKPIDDVIKDTNDIILDLKKEVYLKDKTIANLELEMQRIGKALDNPLIRQLLSLSDYKINEFCENRLKPYLKMNA